MSAFLVSLMAFLAMVGHSDGAYCVCKDGATDAQLQKNIDYACGNGADCNPIQQNGACFNPNTVKDHCHWAVNSYYQRKGQAGASCDFTATATLSQTAPSQSSSCVFPASPGNAGNVGGTPTTNNPGTGITTPGTGLGTGTGTGTSTPGTGTGMGAGTSTGTGMGTGMGGTPSTTISGGTSGGFGLPPTGTSGGYGDGTGSSSTTRNIHLSTLVISIFLALLS